MTTSVGPFLLDRVVNAVDKVRQPLLRATAALKSANVLYAVAGSNAVALWISRVDEAAVRNTQDVDVLLRRQDLEAAKAALESSGFVHRHTDGIDMFLDSQTAKPRDAVHIIFANEKVYPHEPLANPDVTESPWTPVFSRHRIGRPRPHQTYRLVRPRSHARPRLDRRRPGARRLAR